MIIKDKLKQLLITPDYIREAGESKYALLSTYLIREIKSLINHIEEWENK